jgi:hypothetical protein
MKRINETFEDAEHEALKKAKGKRSWHDFIMLLLSLPPEKNKKIEVPPTE